MKYPEPAPLLARAAQLLRAGRPAEAIAPLSEAARLQPSNWAIQHDLGLALLESGRAADAVAAFRRAIEGDPRSAKAHLRLGIALEAQGEPGAAVGAYRRAATLLPSLAEAHYRAGNLLETLGHTAEAIASFRAAAKSKTTFGRIGAARALLAEDRDAEAERVLRQTLALDPANAMATDLQGLVQADAGRFDEARASYERAIALSPLLAGSYYDLVRCCRITAADAGLVARMQAAVANPNLAAGQRLRVHLAIGKAADDLGDFALAMRHFDAADTIRRTLQDARPSALEATVERLIACFTPQFIAQASSLGHADATPVLIVGMPRSGTTLVEQIVSAHPEVAAAGELHFWNERGAAWEQAGAAPPDAAFLERAAADYLGLLRRIAPAARRVTDKMPLNFIWAGLIHVAFPQAVIVHCRRAAIDTALSIHQTYFNPRLRLPTGGHDLVAYYQSYRRLTDHWRRVLPADRFIEVDYERLTAEPEPTIRRLIAGCGLEWAEGCLHPEDNARVIRTPSKWQARQPIYRTAVDRWCRYEPWLGPLRALLDLDADQDFRAHQDFGAERSAEC